MNQHLSYWLMPSAAYRHKLQQVIFDFSERQNAPVFEPHVTIYCGPGDETECQKLLEDAVKEYLPMTLNVTKAAHTPIYTKTLFIEFEQHEALIKLNEYIKQRSGPPANYQLNPHLSLLYDKIDIERQKLLTSEINLPWRQVEFDSISVISTPAEIQSADEIAAWRHVASVSL